MSTQSAEQALYFFQHACEKDRLLQLSEKRVELFRSIFAKAHYNIGMIYDKLGKLEEAADSYKTAMHKC